MIPSILTFFRRKMSAPHRTPESQDLIIVSQSNSRRIFKAGLKNDKNPSIFKPAIFN